ncbi:MAG: hypothetical protein AAGI23_00450 [Bacteroidota bacterium]
MNTYLFSFLLTLWSLTTFAQSSSAVDHFRGVRWGTSFDQVAFGDGERADLVYAASGADGKYYMRRNEDLTIGTALLENIYYIFDENDQFYKVIISGKAASNEDMEFILQQRFGKADKRYRKRPKYVRQWDAGDVVVIFSEQRSKDFVLQIESNADVKSYIEINSNIEDF